MYVLWGDWKPRFSFSVYRIRPASHMNLTVFLFPTCLSIWWRDKSSENRFKFVMGSTENLITFDSYINLAELWNRKCRKTVFEYFSRQTRISFRNLMAHRDALDQLVNWKYEPSKFLWFSCVADGERKSSLPILLRKHLKTQIRFYRLGKQSISLNDSFLDLGSVSQNVQCQIL